MIVKLLVNIKAPSTLITQFAAVNEKQYCMASSRFQLDIRSFFLSMADVSVDSSLTRTAQKCELQWKFLSRYLPCNSRKNAFLRMHFSHVPPFLGMWSGMTTVTDRICSIGLTNSYTSLQPFPGIYKSFTISFNDIR
jgi:hypothetical protein